MSQYPQTVPLKISRLQNSLGRRVWIARRGNSLVRLKYRLPSGLNVGGWGLASLPQSNFTSDASTPPRQIPLFFLAGVFLLLIHLHVHGPRLTAHRLAKKLDFLLLVIPSTTSAPCDLLFSICPCPHRIASHRIAPIHPSVFAPSHREQYSLFFFSFQFSTDPRLAIFSDKHSKWLTCMYTLLEIAMAPDLSHPSRNSSGESSLTMQILQQR